MCKGCYYFDENKRKCIIYLFNILYPDKDSGCTTFINRFKGEWKAIVNQRKNNRNS